MFTKILVAVSANSPDTVLASALDVARKYDARLFALHVVDPTPCFIGVVDYDFGLLVKAMQAHGSEIVARVTNVLDDHAHPGEARMVTLPMMNFTVGRAIAAYAEESEVDLIVLGERKSSWLRWPDENVAAEVRRHVGTPIQIVSGTPSGDTLSRPVSRNQLYAKPRVGA